MKKTLFLFLLLIISLTACSTETFETQEYPLYFSVMTHMESSFTDDKNEDVFNKHVEQLYWAMDLFEEYDAKLTIETEQPFARAVINSDSPILTDAIQRGHGVGTHADFGAREKTSVEFLAQRFRENKALVDQIVGEENNRGVSGGVGPTDYVLAAEQAGFSYKDGIVYLAYLAQEQSLRPEQETDEEIWKKYHDPAIPEFSEHIYPRFVENAEDFIEDPEAEFVLLNGELGELSSLAEERSTCFPDCELTEEDLEYIYEQIEAANAIRDPTRVTHLYIHMPMTTYTPKNEVLLRSFFAQMQELQKQEQIQWATQGEVYDAKMSEKIE
ncbi:MAG: hypothetical protein Q8R18_06065 [bacterium]|nr:hypothetical protein [bacterium]